MGTSLRQPMPDRDRFSEGRKTIDLNIACSNGKKELRPPPGAAEESWSGGASRRHHL
jgi:hypothetical protein